MKPRTTTGWTTCTRNCGLCAGCVLLYCSIAPRFLTLNQVTTDIYEDVERQNLSLDDTVSSFLDVYTATSDAPLSPALQSAIHSSHSATLWHSPQDERVRLLA
jgi:hypothetical protein